VLQLWEKESDKIKTLSANFTVWEYGDPFGKAPSTGGPPKLKREAKGEIHFAAPDRGSFRELEGGDQRWMCDGTAIYEFNAKEKVLHEYRLPPELQGKAISKGPLPFVFGAKAEMMKQRYAMRIVTPADAQAQIWIEAWPRTQQDAANFNHVQVILDTKVMLPVAIRMYDIDHSPESQKFKVYAFANTKVNGAWEQLKNLFNKPTTPPLWKRVVENAPSSAPAGGPGGAPAVQMKPGVAPSRPASTADKRNQPAPPQRPR
jgi:TIGR03009 family protein